MHLVVEERRVRCASLVVQGVATRRLRSVMRPRRCARMSIEVPKTLGQCRVLIECPLRRVSASQRPAATCSAAYSSAIRDLPLVVLGWVIMGGR